MITAPVGQGGSNAPADVQQIQLLLDARASAGLAIDGACGPLTTAAIKAFQARLRGVIAPDGLIDHSGPTYAALTTGPLPAGAVPDTQPRFAGPATVLADLSHNNTAEPDFAALQRAGVGAVMLKASQGAGFTDPAFAQRRYAAAQAGLLVGAYHFGTAEDVTAQLDIFAAALASAATDLTMTVAALDVETNPTASATNTLSLAQADSWVAGLRQRTGATPLVYGSSGDLGARGGATGLSNLAAGPLWIADYPVDPLRRPAPLAGWMDWTLWQYTSGVGGCYAGPLGGLTSDRSVFRGTPADLAALWLRLRAPDVAAPASS